MKSKGKWIISLLSIMAIVTIIAIIFFYEKPTKVDTASATRGLLQVTINGEGKTRVQERFVIAAPVTGKLTRIKLHKGDSVENGMVVARIEPLPLAPLDIREHTAAQARVRAAQAAKQAADTIVEHLLYDLAQTRRERIRAEKLVTSGDLARQDLERLQTAENTLTKDLEAARFRVQTATEEIAVAQAALLALTPPPSEVSEAVSVKSPIAGKVLRIFEESERVVSAGMPLMELSNPLNLEVTIDLLSSEAAKINPGVPVLIENWGGEKTLQTTIKMIEPAAFTKVSALGIEEQRVNVITQPLTFPRPLGDGYRVEARIVIWQNKSALKIPSSALFEYGEGWGVFTVINNRACLQAVKVGQRTMFEAEILHGLEAGTAVILHPANQIRNGLRVEVEKS